MSNWFGVVPWWLWLLVAVVVFTYYNTQGEIHDLLSSVFATSPMQRKPPDADIGPHAGVYSIQGSRSHMEDAYHAVPTMGSHSKNAFFAVYDGHGGPRAAEFSAQNLFKVLQRQRVDKNPVAALEQAFQELDEKWLEVASARSYDDGSTALCCLIWNGVVYVANVGDSRAVLSAKGKAIEMSEDHKPVRQDEKRRIESAGGRIIFYGTWRVEGVLAVTRAIGDRRLKKYVSAVPEIKWRKIIDGDQFLILASDGVWDVLSCQEACDVVSSCQDMREAAKRLTETAYKRGSTDNITSLVIDLRNFQT